MRSPWIDHCQLGCLNQCVPARLSILKVSEYRVSSRTLVVLRREFSRTFARMATSRRTRHFGLFSNEIGDQAAKLCVIENAFAHLGIGIFAAVCGILEIEGWSLRKQSWESTLAIVSAGGSHIACVDTLPDGVPVSPLCSLRFSRFSMRNQERSLAGRR